jgi:glutathionyl-hydroquinone reductase
VKFKYFAVFFAVVILTFSATSVFAQEGETQVVDEVIAQVNDDVITLSMLKKETKERIDALKQNGMTEQQATDEVNKHQAELIATLVNEKLLLQKGKELDLANEIEAEVNRRMLQIAQSQGINSIEKLYDAMRQNGLVPEDVRRTMRTEMMKQAVFQQEVDRRVYLGFTSEEVKKYYDSHLDKFRKPESVKLSEIYLLAEPRYTGRVSVPVLWDKKRKTIVNNESPEIIRMLNSAFDAFTNVRTDYYPEPLRAQIDKFNDLTYPNINNGVYRAGFATSQAAYEEAFRNVFDTLEEIEQVLSQHRYLVGNTITEADWRLFCTLIRFDAVYYSHFKCNWRHIYEYPNLSNYLRDLYQVPGVAETVSIEQIKRHYYGSQRQVNPTGIVPIGPQLDFAAPHDRARFGA